MDPRAPHLALNISVVIPTIPARAALLDRAHRSVAAQTLPPAAVIVAVDTDRAAAAATRNRALSQVATDFVAFLDDDDELYPEHLKALARFVRLTRTDVAYPGYDADDDPVNMFGLPFDPVLLRRANFIPVTVLAKTEKVREAGGFQPHPDVNGDPCEDWGLWLAMLDRGAKFAHLPRRTWRWHNHETSTRGRGDR